MPPLDQQTTRHIADPSLRHPLDRERVESRVSRPGTSPERYYGPREPGGEPWLLREDGWWKWDGFGWVSEAEMEARS